MDELQRKYNAICRAIDEIKHRYNPECDYRPNLSWAEREITEAIGLLNDAVHDLAAEVDQLKKELDTWKIK